MSTQNNLNGETWEQTHVPPPYCTLTANSLSCYGQSRENYPANRIGFTTFERYNTERVGELPPWPARIQS